MPTKTKKNSKSARSTKDAEREKAQIIELDGKDQVLGRLAVQIAGYLQGKHSPNYQPNKDGNTVVKLKNVHKVQVTGKKKTDKIYWSYSGYPGGIYGKTYEEVFKNSPETVIQHAVGGMLPKNKLKKERLKRLIIEK